MLRCVTAGDLDRARDDFRQRLALAIEVTPDDPGVNAGVYQIRAGLDTRALVLSRRACWRS
jgi:hypothetical protein